MLMTISKISSINVDLMINYYRLRCDNVNLCDIAIKSIWLAENIILHNDLNEMKSWQLLNAKRRYRWIVFSSYILY